MAQKRGGNESTHRGLAEVCWVARTRVNGDNEDSSCRYPLIPLDSWGPNCLAGVMMTTTGSTRVVEAPSGSSGVKGHR